ncbi:hypothetical protein ACX1C1_25225 [Paenibacillus sp. strain BS8-2]
MRNVSIILLIAVMLAVSGCTAESNVRNDTDTAITLTPIPLFEGDAAKYKPFLGAMSGSFKLKYQGTRTIDLDLEIWENGRKTGSAGSLGSIFEQYSERNTDEIEFIISIENLPVTDDNAEQQASSIKIADIRPAGNTSYGFTVSRDIALSAQGLIGYQDPITFEDDASAYVWGWHTTSTNSIHTLDFSPESLAKIEWALLFKLKYVS